MGVWVGINFRLPVGKSQIILVDNKQQFQHQINMLGKIPTSRPWIQEYIQADDSIIVSSNGLVKAQIQVEVTTQPSLSLSHVTHKVQKE